MVNHRLFNNTCHNNENVCGWHNLAITPESEAIPASQFLQLLTIWLVGIHNKVYFDELPVTSKFNDSMGLGKNLSFFYSIQNFILISSSCTIL